MELNSKNWFRVILCINFVLTEVAINSFNSNAKSFSPDPVFINKIQENSIFNSDTIGRPYKIVEKGFSFGYGYGINRNNLPEGNYSPIFFIGKIAISFPKLDQFLNKRFQITLIFEPQLNWVLLRGSAKSQNDFEVGLGVGIQNRYLINSHFSFFYHLILGPQYFSAKTIRQTTGLAFSDNLGVGATYCLKSKWALSGEFRIRHMSNGNIVFPNFGINTNNFIISLSRFIN